MTPEQQATAARLADHDAAWVFANAAKDCAGGPQMVTAETLSNLACAYLELAAQPDDVAVGAVQLTRQVDDLTRRELALIRRIKELEADLKDERITNRSSVEGYYR